MNLIWGEIFTKGMAKNNRSKTNPAMATNSKKLTELCQTIEAKQNICRSKNSKSSSRCTLFIFLHLLGPNQIEYLPISWLCSARFCAWA